MQKYLPLEQIGKGSFGVVRKVKRIADGKILVWKQINFERMTSREKQQLVTEVNILKGLQHPNIVKYQDRIVDKKESKVYIIMEYCSGGDLGIHLKQCKAKIQHQSEQIIWKVCYQLLLALEYCHSRTTEENGKGGKVLHRDIKPANIFINEAREIKLGDFGLSRQMGEHSEFAQTHVGTPYYMSPEQVKNVKYNQKSDIWSAGCLIYEMAALRRPFEASNHLALAKKIQEGRFDRIPYRYSQNLFDLIKKMLILDPDRRLSAKELLLNPVFMMRTKENLLKEKISLMRIKEMQLKEREREFEQLQIFSIQKKTSAVLQEQITSLYKKKSTESERGLERGRTLDKENKNWQNIQYN